jgi:hypothetical protein
MSIPISTEARAPVHPAIEQQCIDDRRPHGVRKPSRGNAQVQAVAAFLQQALASGSVPVADLDVKARAAGLLGKGQTATNSKAFRVAKAALHVRSRRSGFGPRAVWLWDFPNAAGTPGAIPKAGPLDSDTYDRSDATADRSDATADRSDATASNEVLTEASHDAANGAPRDAEFGRIIPLEWVQGIAFLLKRSRPSDVPPHRWRLFLDDCGRFLASPWAERAAELGWDASSLFGSQFKAPHEHLGTSGLLWNLVGGEILRLSQSNAIIAAADEKQRVFQRRPAWMTAKMPWHHRRV